MQRVALIIAGILGVLLGIWYFVTKRTPALQRCRRAQGFAHQVLLTAILFSALASLTVGCARKPDSSSPENVSSADADNPADQIGSLAKMSNWQELKVLWNLLTGDQRVLEHAKDREHFSYSMNAALCNLIVHIRLDEIRQANVMSKSEMTAIEGLFATMLSHYFQKNSHTTCYISDARGGQIIDGRQTIEQQTKLLRKHYRQGTLSKELVAKAEEAIAAKLTILDLLNEEDVGLVTEDEIQGRARRWRDEGKIDSLRLDFFRRTQVIGELLAEKDEVLSSEAKAEMQAAWVQHSSRLTRAIVDLGKYEPAPRPERRIQKALEGEGVPLDLVEEYLLDPGNRGRPALIPIYVAQAGRKAKPLLKKLFRDEQIHVSGHRDGSEMVCTITFPVRDAAREALDGKRLVNVVRYSQPPAGEVYKSNTPEGKALIRQLLKSQHLETLSAAIWPAGESRDTAMIPLLKEITDQHESLHEEVARALGNIGHEDALPLLLELADAGTVDSHTLFHSVSEIGGDAATRFFESQMFTSTSVSVQGSAVHMLEKTLEKDAIPILLRALEQEDKPYLRVEAGRSLQNMGNDAAVPVAMELVRSGDEGLRYSAFRILENASDEASGRFLLQLAAEGGLQNKAIESLIGRGGQLAADIFRDVMASGTEEQMEIVVFYCQNSDFPAAEELLLDALNHSSEAIRSLAVYSLGQRGTNKSLPVLRRLLVTEPALEKPIKQALRMIVENQCRERCDAIMHRAGASRSQELSSRDLFALLVVSNHAQYGPQADVRREFAKRIVDKEDPRMIEPIIMYFAEYAHDYNEWNFANLECRSMMSTLHTYPNESVPKVMEFVAERSNMNRELGLGFLAGRAFGFKPYTFVETPPLEKLLADCIDGNDARVRAEAKRLQHILKSAPEDREFAVVLYDLRIPRDRCNALGMLRYTPQRRLSIEQKDQAVPILVEVLAELEKDDPMWQLRDAIMAAGRLNDARIAPPLKRLVERYDPDDTEDQELHSVSDAVKALESMGYRVSKEEDGRYGVEGP